MRCIRPIAFGMSSNLNLQSPSRWSLWNGTWQKDTERSRSSIDTHDTRTLMSGHTRLSHTQSLYNIVSWHTWHSENLSLIRCDTILCHIAMQSCVMTHMALGHSWHDKHDTQTLRRYTKMCHDIHGTQRFEKRRNDTRNAKGYTW